VSDGHFFLTCLNYMLTTSLYSSEMEPNYSLLAESAGKKACNNTQYLTREHATTSKHHLPDCSVVMDAYTASNLRPGSSEQRTSYVIYGLDLE